MRWGGQKRIEWVRGVGMRNGKREVIQRVAISQETEFGGVWVTGISL